MFSVRAMCRCLRIHPSRFYTWLKNPLSNRAREDERQTRLINTAWKDSGKVYGYRKLPDDLLDQGETCCPNRVARLASLAGIKAQIGYKRRPGSYGGKPSVVVNNTLDRQFNVDAPDTAWVTDITYIKTNEGFAYLEVIIDLFSRRVVGWSTQSRRTTDVVLQALLMAVCIEDKLGGPICPRHPKPAERSLRVISMLKKNFQMQLTMLKVLKE